MNDVIEQGDSFYMWLVALLNHLLRRFVVVMIQTMHYLVFVHYCCLKLVHLHVRHRFRYSYNVVLPPVKHSWEK